MRPSKTCAAALIRLTPHSRIVSDGVWNVLISQAAVVYAMRRLMQPCATPKTCAAALVRQLSFLFRLLKLCDAFIDGGDGRCRFCLI